MKSTIQIFKSQHLPILIFLLLIFTNIHAGLAQNNVEGLKDLPVINASYIEGVQQDYLLGKISEKAEAFRNEKSNELILSNGLISRTFRLSPNAATTSLKILTNQQELVRAVKPEAVIVVNGFTINVGGLTGQPNLAFLYPDWINGLTADPFSFRFSGFKISEPEKRFEWKEVRHHAPGTEWPPKGIKLQMDYRLGELSSEDLLAISNESKTGRQEIYHDDFFSLAPVWKVRTSPSHERSSFINEGKPGEIYTPNNTAVYAEYVLPAGVGLVETSIDAGTDLSGQWGPGIALLWEDRTIKFNMRPGNESGAKNNGAWRFTVFDGEKENERAGGKDNVDFSGTWVLRMRIDGSKVYCEAKPEGGVWKTYESVDFGRQVEDPLAVRIGKLGRHAEGIDHEFVGDLVRLKINEFAAYTRLDKEELDKLNVRIKCA